MDLIVRAVDVGCGNTKVVTAVAGSDIRCAVFPSVAYPFSSDAPEGKTGVRRKTMCIPIGPLFYAVGPEVSRAGDGCRAPQLHDESMRSPEYMALLRGALGMMKVPHIDLLIVGLPVALFGLKKEALEKAMVGRHQVGGGRSVTVAKALAVAQPQGALVHFAAKEDKMAAVATEQSLVIDAGARTLGWVVTHGMRMVLKQSYSINRGMSYVQRLLAAEISKDIGTPYRNYDAIDLALRTGQAPVIFQQPYDMKKHLPLAESAARQAVSTMMQWIETPEDLQNIVLVGGGAFLFRKAVKSAFPDRRIHEVRDPLFANVRGFQVAGQSHAADLAARGRKRRVATLA